MKKCSIQGLDLDCSLCIDAICYNTISAVPTNVQFLGKESTCAKFQTDIPKPKGLVHVCIDRET